jgi:hypothetical protein
MHPLQQMLEESDIETQSYSGRGMYGKTCLGVSIDRGGLGDFIARVIEATQSQVGGENIEEIAESFRRMSTDSLGMGQIVYFPGVPYEGSESDEEDEDEDEDAEVG